MAELILAAIVFPAAVIGTGELLAKYGQHLNKMAKSWKKAPKTIRDFQTLGPKLFSDNMGKLLVRAVEACANSTTPVDCKEALNLFFDDMVKALQGSERFLREHVKKDGSIRGGIWWKISSLEKQLKEYLVTFYSSQSNIEGQLEIMDKNRTHAIADNHLIPQTFKPAPTNKIRDTALEWGTAIVQTESGNKTISVIYEKRATYDNNDPKRLSAEASELARSLSRDSDKLKAGILLCIGYRITPLDLVFEVPVDTGSPQTLWRLLSDENMTLDERRPLADYAGGHSISDRHKLALDLTEAVLSVHVRNLVHKNIRSSSILLFKSRDSNAIDIGRPYLSHWETVHNVKSMSISDPNIEWQEDVYRHPQRQTFQKDSRQQPCMGHDIYSLGVCLLEIGLWEPMIVERNHPIPQAATTSATSTSTFLSLSDSVSDKAFELGFIMQEEIGSGNRTLEPTQMRDVMLALATQLLPSRMGPTLTEVVITCLKWLGDTKEAQREGIDVNGFQFLSSVIVPLKGLRF